MIEDSILRAQLLHILTQTDFKFLGSAYIGKVRDNYTQGKLRYIIASDRLSCFDVVVTTVPFKGQVLTNLAAYWFKEIEDIIDHHLVEVLDPCIMLVHACDVIPVEVVVRNYLSGSAWRDYEAGKCVSGIKLPPGLRPSQKLPERIITPSTKAAKGTHDEPISRSEILERGIVAKKLWEKIEETAHALFLCGEKKVAEQGLILVDTKYEFGLFDGKLMLVDELHTLDSSRYWVEESYHQRLERGEAPEMLDKEPIRQWLLQRGFKGEGPIPEITDEHRVALARHYIGAYERITGWPFTPVTGPASERVEKVLRRHSH